MFTAHPRGYIGPPVMSMRYSLVEFEVKYDFTVTWTTFKNLPKLTFRVPY